MSGPAQAPGDAESTSPAGFEALWRRHHAELMARSLKLLGNRADAEDACSRAALLALQDHRRRAEALREPRAWLLRVISNTCVSMMRERKRRRLLDGEEPLAGLVPGPGASETPEEPYAWRQVRGRLRRALLVQIRALPSHLRQPVVLRLVMAREYRFIAKRLGITQANARKRVQLGREALCRMLGGALQDLGLLTPSVRPGAADPPR